MANFEAFHRVISSSKNLLFLMSEISYHTYNYAKAQEVAMAS